MPKPIHKRRKRLLLGALLGALVALPALADNYPVSGKWTYDDPGASGPAKNCGSRYMSFQGSQRLDTGGGVPGYHNFSVTPDGSSTYQIVDQFATGQISARSNYRLRQVDGDHIELHMQAGGRTIKLRRCE